MPLFREEVRAAQGSLNITAPQAGILLAVPVSEGQTVKTGELLPVLNTERHSLLGGAVGDISARVALQIEAREQSLTTERPLRELQTRQHEQVLVDRIRTLQAEQRQADEERSLQLRRVQLARNTLATLVSLANTSKGAPPAASQAHGRLCGSRLNRVPALCRLPLSIF